MSREAFQKAILENRRDRGLHMAYSDWLLENGFYDEAAFERFWTPEREDAIDWLTNWAKEFNEVCARETSDYGGDYAEDFLYTKLDYDLLIQTVLQHLDGKDGIGLGFETPQFVRETRDELWKNFTLATGRVVTGDERIGFVHCAC